MTPSPLSVRQSRLAALESACVELSARLCRTSRGEVANKRRGEAERRGEAALITSHYKYSHYPVSQFLFHSLATSRLACLLSRERRRPRDRCCCDCLLLLAVPLSSPRRALCSSSASTRAPLAPLESRTAAHSQGQGIVHTSTKGTFLACNRTRATPCVCARLSVLVLVVRQKSATHSPVHAPRSQKEQRHQLQQRIIRGDQAVSYPSPNADPARETRWSVWSRWGKTAAARTFRHSSSNALR